MRTKTVTNKQGNPFRIEAREVPPVSTSPGYRMEFFVDTPIQKCLVLNLTYHAALLLASEELLFNPSDWLWEKGCEMIQDAAESNSLEDGDFVIFKSHIKFTKQLSIDQLVKRA